MMMMMMNKRQRDYNKEKGKPYWACLFYMLVSRNGVLHMRCTDTRETLSK
jgi:hypothetical protein